MNIKQKFGIFFGLIVFTNTGKGQSLITSPSIPFATDSISIFFDASEGNGELMGVDTVYAHTGLITNSSQFSNDWQHVQGTWGSADAKVRMIPLGNNRHKLDLHIPSFYGINPSTIVSELAFVFRNADGSKVGRTGNQQDFKYPVAPNTNSFIGRLIHQEGEFQGLHIGDSINVFAASSADANFILSIND